jgi:hypothetical protein
LASQFDIHSKELFMNTIFRFAYLALCILLAACGTAQKLPADTAGPSKRIGVVSQIGDSLNKQFIGVTVFGNTRDRQDISTWKLDALYEEQLADAVKTAFKAETVLLSDVRAEFAGVNSLTGPWSAPAFWGPNFEVIADITKRTCQAKGLDAIVVVAKWTSQDILSGTNQVLEGVGIFGRRGIATAHVLAKLGYMDCRSGKAMAESRVLKAATATNSSFAKRVVASPLDAEFGESPYTTWTRADKARIWEVFGSLPSSAWLPTLQEMLPTQ